jgi:hypothetical protein
MVTVHASAHCRAAQVQGPGEGGRAEKSSTGVERRPNQLRNESKRRVYVGSYSGYDWGYLCLALSHAQTKTCYPKHPHRQADRDLDMDLESHACQDVIFRVKSGQEPGRQNKNSQLLHRSFCLSIITGHVHDQCRSLSSLIAIMS